MREVKALNEEEAKKMLEYLKQKNERDYILFLCLLHLGLRVSDVLKLRVGDVLNKSNIYIQEQKTDKWKEIEISIVLKKAIKEFCKNKGNEEYLIKSREGYNQPIKRCRAYTIIKEAADHFGYKRIGCHSARKTFGRKYYMKYKNIEELRKYFNHTNSGITLRYIGLEQEVINKHVKNLWN